MVGGSREDEYPAASRRGLFFAVNGHDIRRSDPPARVFFKYALVMLVCFGVIMLTGSIPSYFGKLTNIVRTEEMKKKNTDGLRQELMDSTDLSQFLARNQEQFVNKNVSELLNHLFEKKNISKAALA